MVKAISIFDNYDVNAYYSLAEEYLLEQMEDTTEPPTESAIWEEANFLADEDWREAEHELKKFFGNTPVLVTGRVGLWHGDYAGGFIAPSFMTAFNRVMKDCEYWSFTDENGHLVLRCSHHDGTNVVEFLLLPEDVYDHYQEWEYSSYAPWERFNERELHAMLIRNRKAKLPHFAKRMWGAGI